MRNFIILSLSILIIIGFMLDSYSILEGKLTTDNPNVLLLIGNVSGAWQSMVSIVVAYWFGTTRSSADKNSMITDTISKLPAAAQTTVSATVTTPAEEQPKKPGV